MAQHSTAEPQDHNTLLPPTGTQQAPEDAKQATALETSAEDSSVPIRIAGYGAILFDLDGVITPTAELHQEAWAHLFSDYLASPAAAQAAAGAQPAPYRPEDYFDYLDGRPRAEGIGALLASRGISLPDGDESEGPGPQSIAGLGTWKNQEFLRMLGEGIKAYPGSVALINWLDELATASGVEPAPGGADSAPRPGASSAPRMAIVSSSKNARPVLEAAGLLERFELIVDGLVAQEKQLPGKPAPDTYLYAAQQLGVPADQAVVVEDALSGVASGKNGEFGLVIGVDRGAGRAELLAAGADVVVADLAELLPTIDVGVAATQLDTKN